MGKVASERGGGSNASNDNEGKRQSFGNQQHKTNNIHMDTVVATNNNNNNNNNNSDNNSNSNNNNDVIINDNDAGGGNQLLADAKVNRRKGFDWLFRHPWSRLFISGLITILNFIMLAEDPVAHSYKEADVPVIGDGISFILARYPDTAGLRFLKVIMWMLSIISGILIGFCIHRFLLGRVLKLKMFEGTHGSWTVMFFTSIPVVFVGSRIYNAFLRIGDDNDAFIISSLMGTSNEIFMKIAAVGTWLGDFITFLMVLDMCLQQTNEYPEWMPGLRRWWNSGVNRVIAFWGIFVIFSVIVISFISLDIIDHDESFGDHLAPSTESGRTLLAAVITVMDLMIVAGDWDFPSFDNPFEIKLPGFNTAEIDVKWISKHIKLPEFFEISISGRWFNYGIILVVMCLDFNMMKNQIIYEPFDFAQYTEPSGHIWTVDDKPSILSGTEQTLTYEVRQAPGVVNDDHRMQAKFMDVSHGEKIAAALPAFIGLGTFLFIVLRSTRKQTALTVESEEKKEAEAELMDISVADGAGVISGKGENEKDNSSYTYYLGDSTYEYSYYSSSSYTFIDENEDSEEYRKRTKTRASKSKSSSSSLSLSSSSKLSSRRKNNSKKSSAGRSGSKNRKNKNRR